MPHRLDRLRAAVDDLESELAGLKSVDAETRRVLEEALHDIQSVLDKAGEGHGRPLPGSLIARLRAAEQKFEVTHPTLSGIVLRTIDALGQLGI
jgi:hypothetical protein